MGDGRAQERGLAHAARPVEHRQPRGEQVGYDDFALTLAAAEEQRIEVGVLESGQPLEGADRGFRGGAHAPVAVAVAARKRPSASAYSSNPSSTTSTSRRRQNSRSRGFGSGWTAHEW